MGADAARREFEALYRRSYGRILPGLIRLAGDFGHAQDALQSSFGAAWKTWGAAAWPQNPEAWLSSVARRRLVDGRRRRGLLKHEALDESHAAKGPGGAQMVAIKEGLGGQDDSLRLIFTCCHPALAEEAQVALTLNTLCGLTAAEIGSAFLVSTSTMAQRLVRVKSKIRDARIPFRVPPDLLLGERLPSVLSVLYLVFNSGYSAPGGAQLIRGELCVEAIRLARLLLQRMPQESELRGLLALMLLQHARASARCGAGGELILLEFQDRSLWDAAGIAEGERLLEQALGQGAPGSFQLQAAIAAVHSSAKCYGETDWMQILLLYGHLLKQHPSPVVELNQAVALAMAKGPQAGLVLVGRLRAEGALEEYSYLHSTHGELLKRLERDSEARQAWERALALAGNAAERSFLQARLNSLDPN